MGYWFFVFFCVCVYAAVGVMRDEKPFGIWLTSEKGCIYPVPTNMDSKLRVSRFLLEAFSYIPIECSRGKYLIYLSKLKNHCDGKGDIIKSVLSLSPSSLPPTYSLFHPMKGKLLPISIALNARQGHKACSLITRFEAYQLCVGGRGVGGDGAGARGEGGFGADCCQGCALEVDCGE